MERTSCASLISIHELARASNCREFADIICSMEDNSNGRPLINSQERRWFGWSLHCALANASFGVAVRSLGKEAARSSAWSRPPHGSASRPDGTLLHSALSRFRFPG